MSSDPSRTIVSIDSLSIELSESGVTLLTKLPPATPGILRIRPAATSDPRASRTVGRLTPNCWASSVSGGSLSPWENSPRRMASRIWCSTCARGRRICCGLERLAPRRSLVADRHDGRPSGDAEPASRYPRHVQAPSARPRLEADRISQEVGDGVLGRCSRSHRAPGSRRCSSRPPRGRRVPRRSRPARSPPLRDRGVPVQARPAAASRRPAHAGRRRTRSARRTACAPARTSAWPGRPGRRCRRGRRRARRSQDAKTLEASAGIRLGR